MFAWWLVGLACAILAHRRRCRQALAEETSRSSTEVENPSHVEERGPKGTSVPGGGDECTKAAEESMSSPPKEQPVNEKHLNSEDKNLKTAEDTASREPEHQQDEDKNPRQTIEATGLDQEGPIKS